MSVHRVLYSLSSLSPAHWFQFFRLGLQHPFLALFSLWATARALEVSVRYFPHSHGGNGLGNAFRHAVWCGFLMLYCCKITSPEKAARWTLKITDLHEQLFPNLPLETEMDLHNNRVGVRLFQSLLPGIHRQFFERSFLVKPLLELTNTPVQITQPGQAAFYPNQLVVLQTSNRTV